MNTYGCPNRHGLRPRSAARRLRADGGNDDHAHAHARRPDDEQELTPEAIGRPGSVKSKNDAESGVESIDEGDLGRVGEHLLVDLRRVGV